MKSLIFVLLLSLGSCFADSTPAWSHPGSPSRDADQSAATLFHIIKEAAGRYSLIIQGDSDGRILIKNKEKPDQVITGQAYNLARNDSATGDVLVLRSRARIDGTVNGDLTLIGCEATIGGQIDGDLTAIGCKLIFEPGATVNGDLSSIATSVHDSENVKVNGDRVNLGGMPAGMLGGAGHWFTHSLLLARFMSPFSAFSWTIALTALVFCLGVSAIFPTALQGTGAIIRDRAPASLLSGIALLPAVALFSFLLLITLIGIIAIPFLIAAMLVFAFVGEAAIFQLIGQRLSPHLGTKPYAPFAWITLGAVICWVLYCIPVVGLLAGSIIFLVGLGGFTIYVIERSRQNPALRRASPVPANPPAVAPALLQPESGTTSGQAAVPPALPVERYFWPRLGASVIDLIILVAVLNFLSWGHLYFRVLIPAWVLYRFAMWAWKGATLGQIVLNLRVVKWNGTGLVGDYGGSMIRALSSLVSLIPFGIGFIWIFIDRQGYAWHDKITETTVVPSGPTKPGT